jgi:SAM-dependent methyltransferase
MTEYLQRNVKKETEEHYRNRWPFAADARRNLYLKYSFKLPLDIAQERVAVGDLDESFLKNPENFKPRDMWQEIAGDLINRLGDNTPNKVGLDAGASSGYFARQLLSRGYEGRLIGVDIEMETQPGVESIIKGEFPNADIILGGSDVQKLQKIDYYQDDVLKSEPIPSDYFDFVTALFLLYHVPKIKEAYDAVHRVAKPGAIVVFSGREKLNQDHLWRMGMLVADGFGLNENRKDEHRVPRSFYDHHGVRDMRAYLETSPKFEIERRVPQGEHLWVPTTKEGWLDYKWAIMTLPYGKHPATGRFISQEDMDAFIEKEVKPLFIKQSQDNGTNGRYFIDYVFQDYFVCRAIK